MSTYTCKLSDFTTDTGCSELIKIISEYNPVVDDLNSELERCKVLLDKTPELINKASTTGWTPLLVACRNSGKHRSEAFVKLLLAQPNVNINHQNNNGWTALLEACRYSGNDSSERTVEILLEYPGVNVNLQKNDGWSPLTVACRYVNDDSTERTVEMLLKHPNIQIDDIYEINGIEPYLSDILKIIFMTQNKIKDQQIKELKEKHEIELNLLKDSPYPGENYIKAMLAEGVVFDDETKKFWVAKLEERLAFLNNT